MTIVNNSTSAFYERSLQGMTSLRKKVETLQNQISTGEKIDRSSDNPVAASRLRDLSRAEQLSKVDVATANRANADLTLTDSALSSFSSYVSRVRELAVQAANGTLTADQRASIGTEIEELHGSLVALANSRDTAGHALFGGESADAAYTLDASGKAVYAGTASSGEVQLGQGQSVTRGVTGPEFLNYTVNGKPTDLLDVVKTLGEALQGAVADPAGAASTALDSLTKGIDSITTAQTVVGARLNWIDTTLERHTNLSELRTTEETEIGSTDIASSVAELQQIMVVLQASQASFSKVASLTLFDAIR